MTKSKEDAVSPVIGVILMVAVTVILAAVIAAFVFGMGSGVQKTKVVAVTASQTDGENGLVTYQGGQDASQVGYIEVFVGDSADPIDTTIGDAAGEGETQTVASVGASVAIDGLSDGRDHVTAVGHFLDGSTQVLLDTYV